mgnify:CR=1 FL=1
MTTPRLPRALVVTRDHAARIVFVLAFAIGGALACAAVNVLLSRIDRAQAAANLARAELVELRLHTHQAPPDTCADLALTDRRVEVLRRVVWTLIESGVHWSQTTMPSLGDALWPRLPTPGWDLRCERMRVAGGEPVEAKR